MKQQSWAFSDFHTCINGGGHGVMEKKLAMKDHNSGSTISPTATGIDIAAEHPQPLVGHKRSAKENNHKSDHKTSGAGGESEHEMHIWTERERRKKMRNMFSSLHALLPQLPAKADKSTIVDEAVKYIKTLQHTLQTLQKEKLEKLRSPTMVHFEPSIIPSQSQSFESREAFLADQGPSETFSSFPLTLSPACFQTWLSPNVVISTCGDDAHFSVCSVKKPGLLTTILYILEKHNLDVLSTHVSSDQHRSMYMIHVHAGGASDQFPEALSVEEIFKLAAGEMNLWLLTC